jgi:hypothetical protein
VFGSRWRLNRFSPFGSFGASGEKATPILAPVASAMLILAAVPQQPVAQKFTRSTGGTEGAEEAGSAVLPSMAFG